MTATNNANANETKMISSDRLATILSNVTFGVEIETNIPLTAPVAVGFYHRGNAVTAGPAFGGNYWKAERDGSIGISLAGMQACEFVSPVLKGIEGLHHLVEFIQWLNAIGARVNRTCGFHVHVGIASVLGHNADVEETVTYLTKVMENVKKYEKGIYSQTGTDRQSNLYCAPLNNAHKAAMDSVKKSAGPACMKKATLSSQVGKYAAVNLRNVNGRGTVEFRAFAATTNPHKALNHVLTAIGLCIHSLRPAKVVWRDWTYSGLTGFRYVFEDFMKYFRGTSILSRYGKDMKKWGMAMAAKWDRRNGTPLTPEHERAMAAVAGRAR